MKSRVREPRPREHRTPDLFDAAVPPVFYAADVAKRLGVTARRVRDRARAELCRAGHRGHRWLFSFQGISQHWQIRSPKRIGKVARSERKGGHSRCLSSLWDKEG